MLLVIDAGNTNVVFAVHDGTEWRGRWRIATRADRTSDEYAVWLLALFQHAGVTPNDILRCVIGTVVPAALYNLRRLCREWMDCEPLIARAPLDWGFAIRVDRPEEVGADRLLNALAAHTRYGGPLIVIDFGTATTFDVVDGDGSYLGGAISPGINLSIEALHKAAARLPRIGIGRPQ
ncbi:MAG: type III pantothenate kinase, partial [Roseomonas sp.]|nr:type III pantothenate kinase [Roseomonas sp.]